MIMMMIPSAEEAKKIIFHFAYRSRSAQKWSMNRMKYLRQLPLFVILPRERERHPFLHGE
jgi:hypothetical protein